MTNITGIINSRFKECREFSRSLEPFEDENGQAIPYGEGADACYVTYTGTLPPYADVVAAEPEYLQEKSLKNAQSKKLEQVEETLGTKIEEGYNYQTNSQAQVRNYQLNLDSRLMYNNFGTGRGIGKTNPHEGYIRTGDNIDEPFIDAELEVFLDMMGSYYGDLRRNCHSLKDQIRAATTAAEVSAIDINAGWPAQDY